MGFSTQDSTALALPILAALGIPTAGWERLVIEAVVGAPVKIYLKGFMGAPGAPSVLQGVKDVAVSDNGDVTVVPHVVEKQETDS